MLEIKLWSIRLSVQTTFWTCNRLSLENDDSSNECVITRDRDIYQPDYHESLFLENLVSLALVTKSTLSLFRHLPIITLIRDFLIRVAWRVSKCLSKQINFTDVTRAVFKHPSSLTVKHTAPQTDVKSTIVAFSKVSI